MDKFTLEELGYFVTVCGAVLTGCIAVIIKSRCKTIDTPCVKCKREILHEKNEIIKNTPDTPRDKEPEPEHLEP